MDAIVSAKLTQAMRCGLFVESSQPVSKLGQVCRLKKPDKETSLAHCLRIAYVHLAASARAAGWVGARSWRATLQGVWRWALNERNACQVGKEFLWSCRRLY
eukprot:1137034-Pelagomonas_calceolata.AAC.2